MRHVLLLMLCCLVLSSTANAFSFSVNITPQSQTIRINETAVFDLDVSHDSAQTETFEIYSPDVVWDITTDPLSDRLLQVPPETSKRTHLIVTPLYVKPGFYGVPITINHAGGQGIAKEAVMIGVVPETDQGGQYGPSVYTDLKINQVIDPRQPQKIYLTLKNQNRRTLDKLDIRIRSTLLNKDLVTSLGPLQEKTLEIDYVLDPDTKPQEDTVRGSVFTADRDKTLQFDLPAIKVRVVPYGDILVEEKISNGLLINRHSYKFTNPANTLRDKTIERNVTYVQSWFLDSSPHPVVKKVAGGYVYQWNFILEPGQEAQLTIKTNHRTLAYLVLIAIIVLLGYGFLRSPLNVKKTALVIERQEGGVSQLKVLITLKNRSARSVRGITIKDKVPAIASIAKEHSPGSLLPEKVMHYDNGEALLKWHLPHLEPHEERIVSYTIRTKMHVIGNLALPPAQFKYNFYGWERSINSRVEKLYR